MSGFRFSIEPTGAGRAWQSKPPGPDVKSIGTNKEFHQIKEKEAVRLEVLAEPNFPVSFTSTDLGAFENDLATITVVANESGWAQASFTATAGTAGPVNVSVYRKRHTRLLMCFQSNDIGPRAFSHSSFRNAVNQSLGFTSCS